MIKFTKALFVASIITIFVVDPKVIQDKYMTVNTCENVCYTEDNYLIANIPVGAYYFTSPYSHEYTQADIDLLAEVMYHENYSNGTYVMQLTGSVVLNRVKDKDFPNNIHDVLYAPRQYATVPKFFTTKIPKQVYELAEDLLKNGSIAPDNVVYQSMFPDLGNGCYYTENHEYFAYK